MEGDAPNIADTSAQDWKYISEGGSTIVFSYAGPPHPSFDRTALRLRKAPTGAHEDPGKYQKPQFEGVLQQRQDVLLDAQNPANALGDALADGEEEVQWEWEKEGALLGDDEPDDPTVVFQQKVVRRLLPAKHLPRLQPVHVARAWLEQLAARTEPLRPPERRAKDAVDLGKRKAVLATDLVGGDGWAVEIKPKWGFLPPPTHLSPETRDVKTRTCRFCMHAHLKSTQGEAVALGYCPLDLYSGDPERMERALRALWDVWIGSGGAVNNLRVFVEGKMVKPSADPTSLAPLVAQLFPSSSTSTPPPAPSLDTLRDAVLASILPLLYGTPVLSKLSTLQRTLDALDIEGLSTLWARVYSARPLGTGPSAADPDLAEWVRFIYTHAGRETRAEVAADRGVLQELEETEAELRYRVAAYLLGASFKDCSLILRLPARTTPWTPPPPAWSRDPKERVPEADELGSVTVIDLDVKGADRLGKWAALDREIVDAYRAVADPRRCVDAHHGAVPLP